jgi:hypothetical protein
MLREKEYRESFSAVGTVTIQPFKIGENGKKYYIPFQKHNLIVEAGRSALIDMLIGERVRELGYIRWGKGGALAFPDGDPLNPLPVDDKSTDVNSFLLDKPLGPFNRVSPTQVEYVETLICDEVDSDVNEAAMLLVDPATQDRSIWAKITFPTVRLTIEQGTGIEIRWVFDFSRAEEIPLEYEDAPIEVAPSEDDGTTDGTDPTV